MIPLKRLPLSTEKTDFCQDVLPVLRAFFIELSNVPEAEVIPEDVVASKKDESLDDVLDRP